MEEVPVSKHKWLSPFSFLYGMGVALRNKFFDWKFLKSKSYAMPVISIGNLAVGGTGKTPHTEYLIELLQENYQVAVLSRGYKRKTNGYVLSNPQSTAKSIGDEPFQIRQKYPEALVAVDEKRCRGIEKLMELTTPEVDVILLDDAFQHRYVEPGLSVLLTDYHRLFCDDSLLPAGRLRESAIGRLRAQVVIVTKCPDDIKPIEYNIISKRLELYPYQHLFFSTFRYGELKAVFGDHAGERSLEEMQENTVVLLVTGIASPVVLEAELKKRTPHIQLLSYGDHHDFSSKDIRHIDEQFKQLEAKDKFILTTEKDATRLQENPHLTQEIKDNLYVLPVKVAILQNQENVLNQIITDYVRKNQRNRSISQTKDAHQS